MTEQEYEDLLQHRREGKKVSAPFIGMPPNIKQGGFIEDDAARSIPIPQDKPVRPSKRWKLKMACPREDDEQAALAKYLHLLAKKYGFKWAHPPNGGDRDVRVAARLKSHGVSKGLPDILIFGSPPNHPHAPGCALELKRRSGGVVSTEQQEWLDYLEGMGWCVTVACGWEDAKKYLDKIGWAH